MGGVGAPPKIRDLSELALDVVRWKRRASGSCTPMASAICSTPATCAARITKRMGVLVVTLTEDRYVNKGPHRPAFPAALRAESVASLAAVDYVAISPSPLSLDAIQALKPDVYVKGADYRDPEKDQTGGIVKEVEAVRAVGGEVAFTDDIVFSSSSLLNRHLPPFSRETARWLEEFRRTHQADEIAAHVEALRGLNVLVVGEAIVDEYVSCEALGKSGKEPILAMRECSAEAHAGGALAIANHLAQIAGEVLVTCTGSEPRARGVSQGEPPTRGHGDVPRMGGGADDRKAALRRPVLRHQAPRDLSHEGRTAPAGGGAAFERTVVAELADADLVIVADYGHGLISAALADEALDQKPVPRRQHAAERRQRGLPHHLEIQLRRLRLPARRRAPARVPKSHR
jgi:bifunctional ADP-heptose synthase (sugar kinase/adenylyltransferase)